MYYLTHMAFIYTINFIIVGHERGSYKIFQTFYIFRNIFFPNIKNKRRKISIFNLRNPPDTVNEIRIIFVCQLSNFFAPTSAYL